MIVIDMENPEDCDFCLFAFWNIDGTLLECDAKGHRFFTIKERTEDGKPDWCPIVGEIKVEGPVVISYKEKENGKNKSNL